MRHLRGDPCLPSVARPCLKLASQRDALGTYGTNMLKALLLLVSALFFALGIIPPRNRVQATETTKLYVGQPFEYVVRSFAYICCVSTSSNPHTSLAHALLLDVG